MAVTYRFGVGELIRNANPKNHIKRARVTRLYHGVSLEAYCFEVLESDEPQLIGTEQSDYGSNYVSEKKNQERILWPQSE